MNDVVQLTRPSAPEVAPEVAIVASLPHSGTFVPPEIAAAFTDEQRAWLRNTDWYLDRLYDFLPELGITMVSATHSRYVADLNRDPAGPLRGSFFRSPVPNFTADGRPVYAQAPTDQSLAERIERYHRPYHLAVAQELARVHEHFGHALLMDLHSYMSPGEADVCLGDGRGTTASRERLEALAGAFGAQQFSVAHNDPWSGGYIVRQHARLPSIEAIQIELRYTTYLQTATLDVPGSPVVDRGLWESTRARLRSAISAVIEAASGIEVKAK
jgi:N-formylglutamate deformylase